jgi:hypothetical protein
MRPLPLGVAQRVRPIPASFVPAFESPDSRYLCWSATLEVKGHGPVEVELGYHNRKGKEADGPNHLRASAWQATELARLGRLDLLGYCLASHHKGRGGKKG